MSRQVSWLAGSGLSAAFPDLQAQWRVDGRLSAYSCGGSFGIAFLQRQDSAPNSLLAPDLATRETVTPNRLEKIGSCVKLPACRVVGQFEICSAQ